MKITVINLDRSEDRRREITSHLKSLGLEFNIHRAVDGMDLPQGYEELVDWRGCRRSGLHVHMGSVANWISQRQVFQDMVDNGPDVITVLEDDAVPTEELPIVLNALEAMTDCFDIVFLNNGPERPFIQSHQLSDGHQLGRLRWSHFGTQGYVITKRAAEVFLKHNPVFRIGIDRALASYWRHGLRVLCVRPPVILHGEHHQSLKLQAPAVRWKDAYQRIRRGWFRTKEGVSKRIAFSQLMVKAHGPLGGLRRILWQ